MKRCVFIKQSVTMAGVARTGLLLIAGTAAALPVGCASSGQINDSANLTSKAVRGDYDQALIMAGDNADLRRQVHERYVPIMTAISEARLAALNNDVALAKQKAEKLIAAIDFMGDQASETLKLLREIVKKRLENGTLGNLWDFLSGKDPLQMTEEELKALQKRIEEAERRSKPKTQTGGTKEVGIAQQQMTDSLQAAARGPRSTKGLSTTRLATLDASAETTDVALRDPNAELLRRAQKALFVPASDYNRDNVYSNADIQAFLAGFADRDYMADRSIDGAWNDQDVTIFLSGLHPGLRALSTNRPHHSLITRTPRWPSSVACSTSCSKKKLGGRAITRPAHAARSGGKPDTQENPRGLFDTEYPRSRGILMKRYGISQIVEKPIVIIEISMT